METTKCEMCGGLNRVRGTVLHVDTHSDPVWRKLLQCTVCAHKSYRAVTQSEYAEIVASQRLIKHLKEMR